MKTWTRHGIVLYGIGILLTLPSSFEFFLGSFGKGGVPECRGRMAMFDKYFPEDTDYILFNHGNVTPISKEYYDLTQRAKSMGNILCLVGGPLFLLGLLCYMSTVGRWLALFIPTMEEPFITSFAKIAFLLTTACVFGVDKLVLGHISNEQQFVTGIYIIYASIIALSLVLTLVVRKVVKKPVEQSLTRESS